MALVHGTVDPAFAELRDLFQGFLDSGEELGASISVNLAGRDLVNIWGGHADADRTRPWDESTIVNVFSTTKTVTSLAVLMLIDRGLISANDKVAKYWPEFAANGKQDVEVRHLLSHTSGVPGWDDPMAVEDLFDFDKAASKLAAQSPWWTPGTESGYHSWTFGYLLGTLVRRAAGKTLKAFISEEIAGPLQADFQLGAKEEDWSRVSNVIPPPAPDGTLPFDPTSIAAKVMLNPVPDANVANTPQWRQAEIGSANGHTNAHTVSRILSAVTLGGTVDGHRLLRPDTIDLIFVEQAKGVDLVTGAHMRHGIGYGITGDGDTLVDSMLPRGRVCFWGGWGGSMAIMDLDRQLTIAYTMNKMENVGLANKAARAYLAAIYKAVAGKTTQ
ncbi:beta-lactamase [Coniochaeta ligniaria NRRL 30616]|uniref:Beta-lactamase n=1 Tax=Coniochaeta ligniaria NRRL 30616 TaxID=1408157 RepID=A0A1J7ILH5_9PEZI|nr:beta-lactamase [Coniochaeta ligniaria NRRL 30616]